MATFPIPSELVLALVLLPGYLVVRVGLYFARYAGPVDWPEYEKTALSLVGSAVLLAGTGVVFPEVVTVEGGDGELRLVTAITLGGYVAILAVAVVAGAVLGYGLVTLYGRLYGLTRRRVDPREYLLQRLETPIPARIVTDEEEIAGSVRYADGEGNPTVVSRPRLVTSRDGTEYRERIGTYAYVDPATIERVYFGSRFKPEDERGGLAGRARRYVRSLLGMREGVEPSRDELGETEPTDPAGPTVTVVEGPLHRETDRVRARGTARNELGRELRFVQVRVAFEDADGAILGTAVDSFERLGPEDAWRFDVEYATDAPDAVESFAVRWYASPPI